MPTARASQKITSTFWLKANLCMSHSPQSGLQRGTTPPEPGHHGRSPDLLDEADFLIDLLVGIDRAVDDLLGSLRVAEAGDQIHVFQLVAILVRKGGVRGKRVSGGL